MTKDDILTIVAVILLLPVGYYLRELAYSSITRP